MDSIIWAFRHTERNIAETGLNLLLEMLKNFEVLYYYYCYLLILVALATLQCMEGTYFGTLHGRFQSFAISSTGHTF